MSTPRRRSGQIQPLGGLPLVLLGLTLLCTAAAQTVWTVTYDATAATGTVKVVDGDGNAVIDGALVIAANGTASIDDTSLAFLTVPETVTLASLPEYVVDYAEDVNDTAGGVTAELVADGLYRLNHIRDAPDLTFVGFGEATDLNSYFYCANVLLFSPLSLIHCEPLTPPSLSAAFDVYLTPLPSSAVAISADELTVPTQVRLDFYDDVPPTVRNQMVLLSVMRLRENAGIAERTVPGIKQHNANRDENNQRLVLAMYTLAMIGMLFLLISSALWQSWWRQIVPRWAELFWFVVYVVALIIIFATSGVLGWLIFAILLTLHTALIAAYYCIVRRHAKKYGGLPTPGTKEATVSVPSSSLDSMMAAEYGDDAAPVATVPSEHRDSQAAFREAEIKASLSSGNLDPTRRCDSFARYPNRLYFEQYYLVVGAACIVLAVFLLGIAIWMGAWHVQYRYLYDRSSGVTVSEYQPQNIAKVLALVYTYHDMCGALKMNKFFRWATTYCGDHYRITLSNQRKRQEIYVNFIQTYHVDMSIYNRTDYLDYSSVNDWFGRELASDVRPLAHPTEQQFITSVGDARVIAFEEVPPDQTVWIKDEDFSVKRLLGKAASTYNDHFQKGTMLIFRLAPQDYHRFHAPLSGTVEKIYHMQSTLHSVSADAMISKNDAIFNTRAVVIIANPTYGKVALIPIGAVCVGSVKLLVNEGDTVNRGDEVGLFQFGGSTVALLFEKPESSGYNVVVDEDILTQSARGIESLVEVRSRFATFTIA